MDEKAQSATYAYCEAMAAAFMKLPTIREMPAGNEPAKAKFWRQHVAGLRIEQLAELTGYSQRTIYLMEEGCTADGYRISDWVWQRYKRCCAAVHYERLNGKKFNWGQ
jgi:hypothetical protein